jgi:hypothetical protein
VATQTRSAMPVPSGAEQAIAFVIREIVRAVVALAGPVKTAKPYSPPPKRPDIPCPADPGAGATGEKPGSAIIFVGIQASTRRGLILY